MNNRLNSTFPTLSIFTPKRTLLLLLLLLPLYSTLAIFLYVVLSGQGGGGSDCGGPFIHKHESAFIIFNKTHNNDLYMVCVSVGDSMPGNIIIYSSVVALTFFVSAVVYFVCIRYNIFKSFIFIFIFHFCNTILSCSFPLPSTARHRCRPPPILSATKTKYFFG